MRKYEVLKQNLERLAKMTTAALNELKKENPNSITISNITEEGIWGLVTDGLSVDRSSKPNLYDNLTQEYRKGHKTFNCFSKDDNLVCVGSLINHNTTLENITCSG